MRVFALEDLSDTLFCNETDSRLDCLTRKMRSSVVSGEHRYHLSWELGGSETKAGFTCFQLFTCLCGMLEIPRHISAVIGNYWSVCDDGLATGNYVHFLFLTYGAQTHSVGQFSLFAICFATLPMYHFVWREWQNYCWIIIWKYFGRKWPWPNRSFISIFVRSG